MTLEKADELIAMHSRLGSGHHRNACHMVSAAVILDHDLEKKRKIKLRTKFENAVES